MKPLDVYFVVLPGTMMMDLAGVGEPFRVAKRFGADFRLHFVGPKSTPKTYLGLSLHRVDRFPQALPPAAVVFVPGIALSDEGIPLYESEQASNWLRKVIRPDTILCTVCTGAFVAASAGLLNGRQCTTHNAFTDALQRRCPHARVVENRIFVKDGNLYSSAGITAGVDLVLHLISELAGPLVALEVAKFLVIYLRRAGSDPQFSPWLVHRNHVHPRIHQVQDLIIQEPAAEWTVAELAKRIHTCPRHLTRLFKAHAGVPPLTYLRQVRTATAKQLMLNSTLSLERVAELAGFSSTDQMRRAWKRFEQTMPSESRKTRRSFEAPDAPPTRNLNEESIG